MRRWCRLAAGVVILVATVVAFPSTPVRGEPGRAIGSNTGDGTTAFMGLAQAPEANLIAGGSTTSIPILVPPGRKAMTPKLALSYSSNSAMPSPYGYGWDLPLGRVQRSTKHGVLSCTDPTYRNDFVVDVAGTQIECTLDAQNRCNAWAQESFVRTTYNSTDNTWNVWDRSGFHYVFAQAMGSDTSSLFTGGQTGSDCGYTFFWLLTKIEDTNLNDIEITYTSDGFGIFYPDVIVYGGNGGVGHGFTIDFVWSNEVGYARPAADDIVNSLGGFPARLTKLLSEIVVSHNSTIIRSYLLQYEDQIGTMPPLRMARQSFLSAVILRNGAGEALSRVDGAPTATTFIYQENELGFAPREALASYQPPTNPAFGKATTTATNITYRDLFDVTGDGIADWVDAVFAQGQTAAYCAQGAFPPIAQGQRLWCVFPGIAGGGFGPAVPWLVPEAANGIIRDVDVPSSGPITVKDTFDMNGDGVPDFVDASGSTWQVYFGQGAALLSHGGFSNLPTPWPAQLAHIRESHTNVFPYPPMMGLPAGTADIQDVIDMNGDGLPDLVRADSATWDVRLNNGAGFSSPTPQSSSQAFLRFTAEQLQLINQHLVPDLWPSVWFAIFDMNGDGLPDVIQVGNNELQVQLNLGHAFAVPKSWPLPALICDHGFGGLPRTHRAVREEFGPNSNRQVFRDLFDINGDGLPDSVTACGSTWTVYFNRGNGFSPTAYAWPNVPSRIRDAGDTIYLDTFDADGDGIVDSVDFTTGASPTIYRNAGGAWCPSDGFSCGYAPLVTYPTHIAQPFNAPPRSACII